MSDLVVFRGLDARDLLWRILVTVLLLLILAGPGARVLSRAAAPPVSASAPVVRERR